MPTCPTCGSVLQLVTDGYVEEAYVPGGMSHPRGVPPLTRLVRRPFVACSGCEYCSDDREAVMRENRLRYRVNFGNGQVHELGDKRACLRYLAEIQNEQYGEYAFVEWQDPETGDWFPTGRTAGGVYSCA